MRYQWSDGYCPNLVSDWGSSASTIMAIGEAPGESEDTYQFDPSNRKLLSIIDKQGKVIQQPKGRKVVRWPFVGRAGQILDVWLKCAGLSRDKLFITNVVPFRPEDNKFGNLSDEFIEAWKQVLHSKIHNMPNLRVIVPMGNHALEAVTGEVGITDWRGSVLVYKTEDGRQIKVIPALHPAGFFHQPAISYWAMHDWNRIADEATTSEIVLEDEPPVVCINPTLVDLELIYAHFTQQKNCKERMSVDIENNPETHLITCIGIACQHQVISIPLEDGEYWVNGKLNQAWTWVERLLDLANSKVMQGGMHDGFYLLRRKGIKIRNWTSDTLAKSHALTPCAPTKLKPHSLGNLASIYLKTRHWKKDAQKE